MKTASIHLFDSRVFKNFLPLILLAALACFAPFPSARAKSPKDGGLKPAPDGGYANNNTAEGDDALFSLTTGFGNTAIGFETLRSDTAGSYNTANGRHALFSDTTGSTNTATGVVALYGNTTGGDNTATGVEALFSNTTGNNNTATGVDALSSNTTGSFNTANGTGALFRNTTGENNTATGISALHENTTGHENTASGIAALALNTTGYENTATGVFALNANTTGSDNAATGYGALNLNTTGDSNTAGGSFALLSNTTGSNNIAFGYGAGSNLTTGSNNIDIGNLNNATSVSTDVAGESNTIRIGVPDIQKATFIAGIHGTPISGAPVVVNANGRLGVAPSSARFKDQVKPMNSTSDGIYALKPVTFHYKHEIDPKGAPQFGLIAEEVEKVNPDLVARDADGKVYTVRYDAVNAMLLNEFIKEHHQVQELKAIATQQQKEIETLTASMKEQSARIQKVSDKLELGKPALRTVRNNR